MKCFYHSADLDGKCSAAIVKYKYEGFLIDLIGIDYGQQFPWETVEKGELVYMVDFCLQPFSEMIRLNEAVDLIWIDHHKTAISDEKKYGVEIQGLRRNGTGACELVWEYLFHEVVPEGVSLLADYDVWRFDNSKTLPFQYGMRMLDNHPESAVWKHRIFSGSSIGGIVADGRMLLEYEEKQNQIQARTKCFDLEFDGLRCIAMNHGPANSKAFGSVWDPDKYDAMLSFYWKKNHWVTSLYTTKEDVDVSEIAKARGGGGHKGAAGFQSDKPPMEI